MVGSRRSFHGDDDSNLGALVQESKRRATFKNAAKDVIFGVSMDDLAIRMEPFLRSWAKEEVERVIARFFQSQSLQTNNIEPYNGRKRSQLRFANQLSPTIFTGSKIQSKDRSPIKIVLFDATTGTTITLGPFGSAKIEIVVLDGDFGSEDWTEEVFNSGIVKERQGRRPLVTGCLHVTLTDGVGEIGDVVFTDNSSWMRSRKFRLGARILQRVPGHREVVIREARSDAFIVKDQRGELYKKHYPPSWSDEVWRLKKIAKDGPSHKRLARHGINTVKDFLRVFETKSTMLRNIIGGGVSDKKMEIIITHAMTCVLDDNELYAYFGRAQRIRIVFNSIYKVIKASFDDQTYQDVEKLTLPQKIAVDNLKRIAFNDLSNMNKIDKDEIVNFSNVSTSLQHESIMSVPPTSLMYYDYPITQQGYQFGTQTGFNQPSASTSTSTSTSTPYNPPMIPLQHSISSPNGYPFYTFSQSDFFPRTFGNEDNSWLTNYTNLNATIPSSSSIEEGWPIVPSSSSNDMFFTSQLGFNSSLPSFAGGCSVLGKRKAGWCKIKAVVRIRAAWRCAAAKKFERLMYINYN